MLIVADSKIPFLNGVFEPFADMRYLDPGEITPETVRDADALIIRTRTRCAASLLDGFKNNYPGKRIFHKSCFFANSI